MRQKQQQQQQASIPSVPISFVSLLLRDELQRAAHSDAESDGSAPCCDMSGCPSLWSWPRSCTTPQEDRGCPGPGRRISSCTTRRNSGRILLRRRQAQCTLPWTSMMCLPPGAPGLTGSRRSGRRSGFCGGPCMAQNVDAVTFPLSHEFGPTSTPRSPCRRFVSIVAVSVATTSGAWCCAARNPF